MAMDQTDRTLLKGLIGFGVLAGVLYFYPFSWPAEGFRTQVQKVEDARKSLEPKYNDYVKYYPTPAKAVIGDPEGLAPVRVLGIAEMASRLQEYRTKSQELLKLIAEKQAASRMNFAAWTEVPKEADVPGFYFQETWDRIRLRMEDESRRRNVDIMDPDIGFGRHRGDVRLSEERARELLRELFITEKVITLCIEAKQEQEELEHKSGLKSEAFMRIISVQPEVSVRIGPYSRTENPKYDKDERNPKSERYQKYITREWDKFILMYPVEIRLQCDVNSFRNFLNSVRSQKGQFLVIRNLEIVSPFMLESKADQNEFRRLAAGIANDMDFKEEHIFVKLSAAGMDFFEPEVKVRKAVSVEVNRPKVRIPMGH